MTKQIDIRGNKTSNIGNCATAHTKTWIASSVTKTDVTTDAKYDYTAAFVNNNKYIVVAIYFNTKHSTMIIDYEIVTTTIYIVFNQYKQ